MFGHVTSQRTRKKWVEGWGAGGLGQTGRGQKGQSEMGPQMKMTLPWVGYLPVQTQIVYGPGGQHSPTASWMLIKPRVPSPHFSGIIAGVEWSQKCLQNLPKSVHKIEGMIGNMLFKLLCGLVSKQFGGILYKELVSIVLRSLTLFRLCTLFHKATESKQNNITLILFLSKLQNYLTYCLVSRMA